MPGTSSPPVAAASDHVTGGAAGQLRQVGLGHLGQVQLQLGGQLGEVPEHIPELQAQVVAHSGSQARVSTMLVLLPSAKVAVAVLCNLEGCKLAPVAEHIAALAAEGGK